MASQSNAEEEEGTCEIRVRVVVIGVVVGVPDAAKGSCEYDLRLPTKIFENFNN